MDSRYGIRYIDTVIDHIDMVILNIDGAKCQPYIRLWRFAGRAQRLARSQGLTLVHFSAQPEPYLT
jgi:hypothetical protein